MPTTQERTITNSAGDNGELVGWGNQQTPGANILSRMEDRRHANYLGRTNSAPHLGLTAFKSLLIFFNEI